VTIAVQESYTAKLILTAPQNKKRDTDLLHLPSPTRDTRNAAVTALDKHRKEHGCGLA
jgi:hypothetical protein